jgi:hypothetical protein
VRTRDLSIEASGNISQVVAGDHVTHCEGTQRVEAGGVSITSHREALSLDATYDLALQGQRVLINC